MASVDGNVLEPASSPPPAAPTSRDHEDLDPATFLRTVRELSEKREREDAERYRKLEEEVEKSRADRAARRSERERSISPEKTDRSSTSVSSRQSLHTRSNAEIASPSPLTSPPASISTSTSTAAMADNAASPPSPTKHIPEFRGFGSVRRPAAAALSTASSSAAPSSGTTSSQPSQSASSLARSGTLSWQRRPTSRGGSRPQSVLESDVSAPAREMSTQDKEPSRDQIAATLGSRDPSWFRQTADRGIGSAAYRKSQEEAVPDNSVSPGRRGLPGMSRKAMPDPEPQSSPISSESTKSEKPSRFDSVRGNAFSSMGDSAGASASASSKPDLKALVAADEGQLEASPLSNQGSSTAGDRNDLGRTPSMSSSQARLAGAVERPNSPTKGMGGFVQSAMMKRSDSVSKRWSAQPGGSLSRQSSAASGRTGFGGLQGSHSMPKLDPTPGSREGSHEPSSRPTSSSSNLTTMTRPQGRDDDDVFVKPALPHHSRSKTVSSIQSTTGEDSATSPPSSPSKRFSPTKSSWIESALTRPDSPKPAAAKNTQPSWMESLAKAKAQRASAESTPRPETSNPVEDAPARSSSPTKRTPFGQSILKRSESRDLAPTQALATPSINVKPSTPLSKPASSRSDTPAKAPALGIAQGKDESQREPIQEPLKADPVPASPEKQGNDTSPSIVEPVADTAKPKSLLSVAPKAKPETPPKPSTDFRSILRSRAPPDQGQADTPEFLSKFGSLRKAQTEKYVAPDVLKSNITRGKAELTKTGGPVKTVRRDELKESLLAKKDEWKKAKEDGRELPGQVHERKTSGPPSTPSKPEALMKRDLLGRTESVKQSQSPEKTREATPEALARLKSLRDKPKVETPLDQSKAPTTDTQPHFERLSKQSSAPASMEHRQPAENSKIAARFNPALASVLARGPPTLTSGSTAPSRSESPAVPDRSAAHTPAPTSEPPADGGPLQDMRKGRARGPKKRKGTAGGADFPALEQQPEQAAPPVEEKPEPKIESPLPVRTTKPKALPGSAAAIMAASLKSETKDDRPEVTDPTPLEPSGGGSVARLGVEKPMTPSKSPVPFPKPPATTSPSKTFGTPAQTPKNETPTFRGFGATRKLPTSQAEDDKENTNSSLPSVKSVASIWGQAATPKQTEARAPIQLPSKKDEEAAMRAAGLLASSSSRPSSSNGLGISVEKSNDHVSTPPASAGLPPKPAKPSRIVSGQLQEASPNKGDRSAPSKPRNEAGRLLAASFGDVPIYQKPLSIDTRSVIAESLLDDNTLESTTLRKSIQEVRSDGSLRPLPPREEYTLFDEAVYVCTHVSSTQASTAKRSRIFIWTGDAASKSAIEQAQVSAKRSARTLGSATTATCEQGYETSDFLQAMGGIMVSRRASREKAPKQYMLRGRKHLGHIVFDEIDHSIKSLCAAFVYLISHPVTLQQTKLYLWKGSASSPEEISAARLAAMDLSETGEIIEVDDGAEFASFLKIFSPTTTKHDVPNPSSLWKAKGQSPGDFTIKLFRVQQAEAKSSNIITSIFTRRPSWKPVSPSRSPTRSTDDAVRVGVKHITPFTQSDLDAEGVYILDAYSELYILVGPLLASQPESIRNSLLGQALLFASEYTDLCATERGLRSRGFVLLRGVPEDFSLLFRHWSHEEGLWGTASLMAGSRANGGKEVVMLSLEAVKEAVCMT